MVCKKIILALFSCALAGECVAQIRFPGWDASIKAGYVTLTDEQTVNDRTYDYNYESIAWHAEAHLQFGQRLALGWYYSRPFFANYHEGDGSQQTTPIDRKGDHLLYGPSVRLSGGRSAKLRPYLQVKYLWIQAAVQHPGYRVAAEMNAVSATLGLMLRANHRLYINIIDAEANLVMPFDGVIFQATEAFPQFRTGLTYNFSKRK